MAPSASRSATYASFAHRVGKSAYDPLVLFSPARSDVPFIAARRWRVYSAGWRERAMNQKGQVNLLTMSVLAVALLMTVPVLLTVVHLAGKFSHFFLK